MRRKREISVTEVWLVKQVPVEKAEAAPKHDGIGRRTRWIIFLPLLAVVLAVSMPFAANAYAASKFDGVTPGMTRTQLDRHLWAFMRKPAATYNSLGPGESVCSYYLLGFDKISQIKVIFNADGTVAYPIPVFSN